MAAIGPFWLGWRVATLRWGFLIRDDRQSVQQCIHLAIAQVPAGSVKALDRAVERELYHLAKELGWRQRAFRLGRNELGQRWERIVIAEGLRPVDSKQRKLYESDRRRQAGSLHCRLQASD